MSLRQNLSSLFALILPALLLTIALPAVTAEAGSNLPDYEPDANDSRDQVPNEYKWSLDQLFSSPEAWEAEIVKLREDIPGLARASVTAEAERWVTVPEDATLNEREATWFALSEALMNDLDVELERALYQYMAAHILN